MSSIKQLPGDFIPHPDDVLVDGIGQQWVPSGWPILLRDDEAGVERLAAALTKAYPSQYESFGPDLAMLTARAIIAALREGR